MREHRKRLIQLLRGGKLMQEYEKPELIIYEEMEAVTGQSSS
ncbi:MAG TPA: hypothetical protein PKN87_09230 [Syntrophomonadaceae bacterium]|nr:hypothetical protein [Syntrophomonadaceae bacterium]HPR94420.1 hypothetical protein [Syntrophomonadaceae bacterium]